MADEATTTQRREQRPTEVAARLERMRKRNADQLEQQRAAERRVEAALAEYLDADTGISGVERDRDEKIAGLHRQMEQARVAAQAELERIRRRQAVAVWQLKDAGRTVEQITDLLELPAKETRQLLATGRAAVTSDAPTPGDEGGTPAGNPAPDTGDQGT